jgi:hypothetical protein
VTAPDQTQWTVRVAWEPRWRALARRFGGWRRKKKDDGKIDPGDIIDGAANVSNATPGGGGGGGGGGIDLGEAAVAIVIAGIALIIAALLFWWVLLPLLLLVLDLVIVLILLVLAIVGRVLFRRPWTVEATSATGQRITADVVGWRAALRKRDELAEQLAR